MVIKNREKGQVLLIVLLVTVVALTLGLGAISQSITDIKISEEEEESARAFNLAEAGIEEALRNLGVREFGWDEGEDGYNVSVVEEAGFSTPQPVEQGDVIQLTVNGADGRIIRIDWDNPAALEVIALVNDSGNYVVQRWVYDDIGRIPGADNPVSDYTVNFTIPTDSELLRLRPLFSDSSFTVAGNIPDQQYRIEATGQTASGVTRKIQVTREIAPSLPGIFDYALFSGGAIP
ncbi:hypothetical protein KKD62_02400 [Patescibacteria group bacterium]|nr:hypothetical protein [Patescibacteria group bacterium]MBU1931719.1 hypothetical protein [Patescibacteria group bacterium]